MHVSKLRAATIAVVAVAGLVAGGTAASAAPLAAAPEPGYAEIVGKVVDAKGKAVAGAPVYLYDASKAGEYSKYAGFAETSPDGTFAVSWIQPGTYRLLVAPQVSVGLGTYFGNTVREPEGKVITVADGATATANVKLVAGASVKGVLKNSKGKVLKNTPVYAYNLTRTGHASATTDSKGRYVLHGLASGKVSVYAYTNSKTGVITGSGEKTVTAKQGKTVNAKDLKLKKPSVGTITATVKGGKVGDYVGLYNTKTKFADYAAVGKKGKVSAKVAPGSYRVVIPGTNVASKVVTVKKNKTAKAGKITKPKKTTKVTGTIKGANGKAVADAYVQVLDSYGLPAGSTSTNAKGKYSVSGVVSGKYTVTAANYNGKDAAKTVAVTVKKGKNAKKSVKLAKGYTVKGTVKHGKKAVANVSVTVGGRWGQTDAKGTFAIHGVPKGKHILFVDDWYTGGFLNSTSKQFTVSKNLTKNASVKK